MLARIWADDHVCLEPVVPFERYGGFGMLLPEGEGLAEVVIGRLHVKGIVAQGVDADPHTGPSVAGGRGPVQHRCGSADDVDAGAHGVQSGDLLESDVLSLPCLEGTVDSMGRIDGQAGHTVLGTDGGRRRGNLKHGRSLLGGSVGACDLVGFRFGFLTGDGHRGERTVLKSEPAAAEILAYLEVLGDFDNDLPGNGHGVDRADRSVHLDLVRDVDCHCVTRKDQITADSHGMAAGVDRERTAGRDGVGEYDVGREGDFALGFFDGGLELLETADALRIRFIS